MKGNILSVAFMLITIIGFSLGESEKQQLETDIVKVKENVLEWADSVFYHHEGYRFEHFHAHYTEEFYIVMLRSDQYRKKIEELEKSKEEKKFFGSEDEYQNELSNLKRKYEKFQFIVQSFASRAVFFEIIFWSNIKTKHGYPVYYSHKFKLSNDFIIMSASIKSSIGNRDSANGIIYNKS